MSDLKKAMALWEWRMVFLEDCPQSEVNELKEAIRSEWENKESREYWTQRILQEGKFSEELQQMGRDATAKIKARERLDAN